MNAEIRIESMTTEYIAGAVALQRACFPAPFPEDQLWNQDHLTRHLEIFSQGQFVALDQGHVVASASATLISEANWQSHRSWNETVGGPFLENFDATGQTLYGLDISVHPDYRGRGIGKRLYRARFDLVRTLGLTRYGTACRLPDFRNFQTKFPEKTVADYAKDVVRGSATDRTLSPLLKYGLVYNTVINDYMEDYESANAAALLEWKP